MIKFKAHASSSKGNLYTVSDGSTTLMLECGLSFPEIRKALDFKTCELAGCLLTHGHGDHARSAKDVLKAGIDLYASAGTVEALGLESHRLHIVRAKERFTVGSWSILPFDTVHDCSEPLGFLLASGEEKLLFVTDSAYVRYRFPGLTLIAIECNYDLPLLKENVKAGTVDPVVKRRILHNHMSLDTVKGFFKANDLSRVQEIWLLHLSDQNSHAGQFKREIQALTGCIVKVS